MKLSEKYEKLKKAAQADMRAVRTRRAINGGYYENDGRAIDPRGLLESIKTATAIGYETHLRVVDGNITIFYVANMPPKPFDVEYA